MSKNNKRARKSKLVPRCEISDMEFIMAEMEQNYNIDDIVITNIKSEVKVESEQQFTNKVCTPKLSIKVEVEPCEEDWHIPTEEEISMSTCLKNTAPILETKEIEVGCESDPEMRMILEEEEEELSRIVSDPKNIEIMEKLFHNNDNKKDQNTTSKTLNITCGESSKELDFKNKINASSIKKETTEAYENILKRITDKDIKYLYKCSLCRLNWSSNEDFNVHIKNKHPDGDTWKIETMKQSLNRVIITLVRDSVPISNNCLYCNEFFSEKIILKEHMEETFKKCSKCMKLFHGCSQFHLHKPLCVSGPKDCICDFGMGKLVKPEDRQCVCEASGKFKKCIVCQAFFLNDKKLLQHQIKYHIVSSKLKMNVTLNKCTACRMSYVGKKDLHECNKMEKRVKCAICKKEFHTQLLLNVHVKAMTKENIGCQKCNTSYYLECEKYDHICVRKKVFSLEYRCNICKRIFLEKEDVHRHIQLEHLIHFSLVPNYISFAHLNEKLKEIKNIHKEQNIVVTFSNDRALPKRGAINNMVQKERVPTHLLCTAEDRALTKTNDLKINTVNLNSDQSSTRSPKGEAVAIGTRKQDHNDKSDLIKVFQGTSTYSKFKIDNQLSSLIKNQKSNEASITNDDNDVELIIEQNECIDIESDDEKLVIDEPKPAAQKCNVPENILISPDRIKMEHNIEAEMEVELVESESLSALFQDLPEMVEEELNLTSDKLKLLRCSNCGLKSSRKLYKNHINSCCKIKPKSRTSKRPRFLNNLSSRHICLLCQQNFTNLTWYFKHFVHHGYEAKQCPYCMKVQDAKTFIMHCLTHIKSNFYKCIAIDQEKKEQTIRTVKCVQCKKDIEEVDYLTHFETHYIKYMPENEMKAQDDKADVKPKLREVPLHLFQEVIKALTEVKMYDRAPLTKHCIICNKKSDRNTEMKRHLIEHLHIDAKFSRLTNNGLVCQICSNKYQSSERFKCHMREHALLAVYECQICNKTFSDSSNFAKHKKVHDIECLRCELCSRKFNSERMYEQHLQLHKTSKLIYCPECKKSFHFESLFKKHYKLAHIKPTFTCQYCTTRHPALKELWDHLWEVHKVRKVQADCEECGARFRKKQALKLHMMKVHTCIAKEKAYTAKKKNTMTSTNENSDSNYLISTE